ncbi:hypothetical protein ACTHOQ_10205 [Solibacillus silvestris]
MSRHNLEETSPIVVPEENLLIEMEVLNKEDKFSMPSAKERC